MEDALWIKMEEWGENISCYTRGIKPTNRRVNFKISDFILKYPIGILTELALQWGNNDIVNIEFSSS